MKYLLDTNVLSEGMRPVPDPQVLQWLDAHQEESAISALTLAELARGVEALPDGKRKSELHRLLSFMQEDFGDAILPFDEPVAWEWARYCQRTTSEGVLPGVMDSLIAATAITYGLTVVTRNTSDFPGVKLLDPFLEAS